MAIRMDVYRGSIKLENRIDSIKCKSVADATTKAKSLYEKVEGKWDGHIQVASDQTGYIYEQFDSYKEDK